jgi:hypothetical protein
MEMIKIIKKIIHRIFGLHFWINCNILDDWWFECEVCNKKANKNGLTKGKYFEKGVHFGDW